MKIKKIFNISKKNFVRDKKNIISIILIGTIFSLIQFCFSFCESLNTYWNDSVEKLVDYRTYVVSFDNTKYNATTAIEKIKGYSNVVEVFDESSYLISMNVNDKSIVKDENGIFLIGTISNPIKLVAGNNLDTIPEDELPIICAKQFYPFIEYDQEDYIVSKSIDISDRLNKYMKLSFINSKEEEKFKIVGLYDAKDNHTEGNVCYTSLNIVKELNKKYQSSVFFEDDYEPNYVYVIIDKMENEKNFISNLEKDGFYNITSVLSINKTMGNNIIKLMILISAVIIVLSIISLMFLAVKKINRRNNDYYIMKSTGYSSSQINSTYFFELIFELLLSIIISFLFYILIVYLFQKIYISNKIIFYNFNIRLSSISILINVLLSTFVSSIMIFYFNYRLKKIRL